MGFRLKDNVDAYHVGKFGNVPDWAEELISKSVISLEDDHLCEDGACRSVQNAYILQGNKVEFVPEGDYVLRLNGKLFSMKREVFESILATP